jgi:hypothetical protein
MAGWLGVNRLVTRLEDPTALSPTLKQCLFRYSSNTTREPWASCFTSFPLSDLHSLEESSTWLAAVLALPESTTNPSILLLQRKHFYQRYAARLSRELGAPDCHIQNDILMYLLRYLGWWGSLGTFGSNHHKFANGETLTRPTYCFHINRSSLRSSSTAYNCEFACPCTQIG